MEIVEESSAVMVPKVNQLDSHQNEKEADVKKKKKTILKYGLHDNPPWYLTIFLGFQHYVTALGGSIALPVLISPALCVHNDEIVKTYLLNTLIFLTGLTTLIQTTFGIRLPIIQGATFAMIAPLIAMFSTRPCPEYTHYREGALENLTLNGTSIFDTPEHRELWQGRMREVQGAIIMASLVQVIAGVTGIIGTILYYIGPLAVAPTIALVGISFFKDAAQFCSGHWGFAILSIALMTIFSQCLHRDIPILTYTRGRGCHRSGYPIFQLFPVILTIVVGWSLSAVLTAAGVLPDDPLDPAYAARADAKSKALTHSDWFRVPYPGQWGTPTVGVAASVGMLTGVLSGILESIGDYYACAELLGAPTPPVHAVNRGIFIEGIGCVLAGFWGSGAGTTSYTENFSVMAVTQVGSRRVIQAASVIMLIVASLGKFGAIFISIPDPIIGGISVVLFGLISSIGIANLQHVDLNASRNLYIFGLSIFCGIMVPHWMSENPGVIKTGVDLLDQIISVLLGASIFIGGFIGFLLDNLIPGSEEERGIAKWRQHLQQCQVAESVVDDSYDLPFIMKWIKKHQWMKKIPISPTFQGFGIRHKILRCRKKGSKNMDEAQNGELESLHANYITSL